MLLSSRSVVSLAIAALLAALALGGGFAPSAPAIVPPTDCGALKVDGKRFKIKADQLRCKPARKYSKRYLARGDKPRGYKCEKYGSDTKLAFRCSHGVKVFFAIRR